VLLNFIYLDILLTDLWLPKLFGAKLEDLEKSGGLNDYFTDNGFSSKFIIKNLGSGFIYLIIYLVALVFYFIIKIISL
jgi:hypothetical protein